jgi:hypothetical protein
MVGYTLEDLGSESEHGNPGNGNPRIVRLRAGAVGPEETITTQSGMLMNKWDIQR